MGILLSFFMHRVGIVEPPNLPPKKRQGVWIGEDYSLRGCTLIVVHHGYESSAVMVASTSLMASFRAVLPFFMEIPMLMSSSL